MYARMESAYLHNCSVRAHIGRGLPGFDIVGLPTADVSRARLAVRERMGENYPRLQRITVEVSPRRAYNGMASDIAHAITEALREH